MYGYEGLYPGRQPQGNTAENAYSVPSSDVEDALGFAPAVVIGAVAGIKSLLGGGGGPSYADAMKRVQEALAKALAGDMTGGTYKGLVVTVDPVTYLRQLAESSQFPEVQAAAGAALNQVADHGPTQTKALAQAIGAGSSSVYPVPPTQSANLFGLSPTVLALGAAGLAFVLFKRARR